MKDPIKSRHLPRRYRFPDDDGEAVSDWVIWAWIAVGLASWVLVWWVRR